MNEYGIGCTDAGLFDTTPGEDLSAYEGCGVYFDGTAWQAASLTSQSVTKLLGSDEAIAVIVQGAETTEKLELAYVTQRGYIEAKAGTGGVTAGDFIVTEYAASGTDRGRFITATELVAGQWVWGKALSTVAEDGLFILDMGAAFQSTSQWASAPTAITTNSTLTLTGDQCFKHRINRSAAGGSTDTFPTASNIISAMTARGMTATGDSFELNYANSGGTTITFASAPTGVTYVNLGGDLLLTTKESARIIFTKTGGSTASIALVKA